MLKKISILFVMIMMIVPTIKITNAQSTGVTFQGEAEKFVLVNSERSLYPIKIIENYVFI